MMRLRTIEQRALPRLAWCARIERGADCVEVHHGPWVETRSSSFFEGAWDGPFEQDDFDEATSFAGTGGRLVEEGIVFAGPTHLFERFYTLRLPDCLLVSNSLPFVLVAADDGPDPDYPGYFFDFCRFLCDGVGVTHKELPTARGRRVLLHDCGNLLVRPDLFLTRREKRVPPEPVAYADYVAGLSDAMGRLFANAAHPARKQRYEPITTVSQGYDAPAIAALGARWGCRDAFTFVDPKNRQCTDDGTEIAKRLGLRVTAYQKLAFLELPEPEPEFHACSGGADIALAAVEPELAGKLVLFGRTSGAPWEIDANPLPALRKPQPFNLAGGTMAEYRLRVGFFQYNPRWFGAQHGVRIRDIACSDEMRPWSTGNDYDKPIPRRIVEEAGVPRSAFGMLKASGAVYYARSPADLTPAARDDFLAFTRSLRGPRLAERASFAKNWLVFHARYRASWLSQHLDRVSGRPPRGFKIDSSKLRTPRMLYTFHWAFERIRARYALER